ncbi:DNA-binding transcriptional regulator, AcrR family [Amycolatopsis lurida]|uniref:TetR family transcriptional regulator n=1 Tax=Amycolatopsis lurida NRRL 2430 TaxID=1460371 RepID=A0A2P2G2Y5_AMYLU|nr:TetR/AcrR family transcriptional regulator [Amycolatopsis lurida]KFU83334.1 TetR family transcriptional regulator [Amycolatopsis lurida NRRL 2430]SED25001.1 DNA-binding transcriptional regulator, AcrR family [Amycolatopsis lurida]
MTATSRKEKAAETEAALKEAAKRVFAAKGYLNTKITDITAEAGRAAGSFYNHFTSKEELLEALLEDLAAASDVNATSPEHIPDFTDPQAVRWHVREYWNFHRDNAATMLALRQAAMVSDEFARTYARFGADQAEDLLDHLGYITAAGMALPASERVTLAMMAELVNGFAHTWLLDPSSVSEEEAVEALTRFVYRGFTGRDVP